MFVRTLVRKEDDYMQPQRVLISRDGSDPDHRAMQNVPAFLPAEPHVGDSMHLWTDRGELVTSAVRRVARSKSEIVVETTNSRYRLQLAA
jgi:hypothetical protein